MKQNDGFSFLGIFYGLVISLGGTMLVGGIAGGVLGVQYAQQGYAPDQIGPMVTQALQKEQIVIVFGLFGLLFLFLGSFIAANTARSATGTAFVQAGMVGLVNFLLNFPPLWQSLGLSYDTGLPDQYVWIGAVAIWPVALLGAVLSVLTVEKPPEPDLSGRLWWS